VTLVQQHMEDTDAGKDTSHACHALTMAHGDFVYWKGFWEVVDNVPSSEEYKEPMVALAQLVCLILDSDICVLTELLVFSFDRDGSTHSALSSACFDSGPALTLALSLRSNHYRGRREAHSDGHQCVRIYRV
jgi:hypothetical protein